MRLDAIRAHLRAWTEIVYCSEWLGYLPYGAYQWIEAAGRDVSAGMPAGWTLDDLLVLEREGFLERLAAEEGRITFRVRA